MRYKDETPEQRFNRRMGRPPETDDCWLWVGTRNEKGYGIIQLQRGGTTVRHRAHRVSHRVHNGPIPDEHVVLHSCDNPPCCNPRHLSAGPQLQNIGDMISKDRHASKITPDEARAMALEYMQGEQVVTHQQLADRYGISRTRVRQLIDKYPPPHAT